MDRIPSEVLGLVFEYVTTGFHGCPEPIIIPHTRAGPTFSSETTRNHPLLLSSVSRQWRQAVLSHAALFSYISLQLNGEKDVNHCVDYMNVVISRSKGHVLDIGISCDPPNDELTKVDEQLLHLLLEQSDRISSLKFYTSIISTKRVCELFATRSHSFNSLRALTFNYGSWGMFEAVGSTFLDAPRLSELWVLQFIDTPRPPFICFRSAQIRHFSCHRLSVETALEMLVGMTALEHLAIGHVWSSHMGMSADKPILNMPTIRRLDVDLDRYHSNPQATFQLLLSIRAPHLSDLRTHATHLPAISSFRTTCNFNPTSVCFLHIPLADDSCFASVIEHLTTTPTLESAHLVTTDVVTGWIKVRASDERYEQLLLSLPNAGTHLRSLKLDGVILSKLTSQALVETLSKLLSRGLQYCAVSLRVFPPELNLDSKSTHDDGTTAWEELVAFVEKKLARERNLKLGFSCCHWYQKSTGGFGLHKRRCGNIEVEYVAGYPRTRRIM